MARAMVRDCRENRSGPLDSFPMIEVKVGDWVGFKSDHEQCGQITKIERRNSWQSDAFELHVHNPDGFGGDYLRYAKDTVVFAEDCWIS